MSFVLGNRSRSNLEGVHHDLVLVVAFAIQRTQVDFTVIEGLRSQTRQQQLYEEGASQTLRSRHLTGHAVDIAPIVGGEVSWAWPLFYPLAEAMKSSASDLRIPLEWGGDWKTFKDGPHFQLPFASYPATSSSDGAA